MPQEVRGVVSREKGKPVTVETIVVPDPGPGEAVVRVQACGVCHTDLHYREGNIEDAYPFLLGHEAAGVVESLGEGVDGLEVGDFVILNWRAVCGKCRACRKGQHHLCFDTHNAAQSMTLKDTGEELKPALGIGAFIEKTLVHSGQCTKVNPEVDPAEAGLIGCGVMAGAGAAVDTEDRKLEWAKGFGATHGVNAKNEDPVERIRELTDGFGADVVIDAVGIPATWKQAFEARDLAGRLVLVGVPSPDMKLEADFQPFFSHGGSLRASWYGDCLPTRDFPMLVDLALQGRFPLDKFVTERISLDDVEQSFEKMHHGDVLRSVVIL
jgi:S-(hydroxymethyl)mycothiol dehydrogenase